MPRIGLKNNKNLSNEISFGFLPPDSCAFTVDLQRRSDREFQSLETGTQQSLLGFRRVTLQIIGLR